MAEPWHMLNFEGRGFITRRRDRRPEELPDPMLTPCVGSGSECNGVLLLSRFHTRTELVSRHFISSHPYRDAGTDGY
jgi:hypothetical protein